MYPLRAALSDARNALPALRGRRRPPRQPGCIWDLHALCDPVNEFCACPCDTGELEETA
jgi:hypothetical protein